MLRIVLICMWLKSIKLNLSSVSLEEITFGLAGTVYIWV